jgi:predicted DNA repair protein MutK
LLVLVSDDLAQVLKLLHLLEVLLAFLVYCVKVLLVRLLHVGEGLLQVEGVAVAAGKGIRELLPKSIHVLLGCDSGLLFLVVL